MIDYENETHEFYANDDRWSSFSKMNDRYSSFILIEEMNRFSLSMRNVQVMLRQYNNLWKSSSGPYHKMQRPRQIKEMIFFFGLRSIDSFYFSFVHFVQRTIESSTLNISSIQKRVFKTKFSRLTCRPAFQMVNCDN